MFAHGSASLQLFPVVWIFLRSLGVICYDRWVLSEGHKNYFKDWCLMNSQSTFLFFNLFKLNELWPYYQKHVNQIILNRTTLWSLALRIFEAFVRILLIVNLSLNQTLLTFLLYVRQTKMTQLILAISPWEVIFLYSEKILVLLCMVSQFMLKKYFLLHGTYLQKTLQILNYVFDWLYSLSVLLLFPLWITFLVFLHSFWFYFI